MTIIEQYKNDIFRKMKMRFDKGKKILDVGGGDCLDDEIFIKRYGLKVYMIDIYKHENVGNVKGLIFKKGSIFKIPYEDNYFDYVFLHDVLHHIDEKKQSLKMHLKALEELKRVCKKGGKIIVLEANRYNPLFYPHMVLLKHHNHFKQSYFKKIFLKKYSNVEFRYFEAHAYPFNLAYPFKIFEYLMEKIFLLKPFIAYNLAIIKNE